LALSFSLNEEKQRKRKKKKKKKKKTEKKYAFLEAVVKDIISEAGLRRWIGVWLCPFFDITCIGGVSSSQ
jgi:hypothetical protein